MLRDIRENNDINSEEIDREESLYDGGPDFNWNSYAVESFGSLNIPNNPATWLKDIEDETERQLEAHSKGCNLPSINLLFANPLQLSLIHI